jgi:protein-L-isoaspartate(D-aspartate) O-methyltransferase
MSNLAVSSASDEKGQIASNAQLRNRMVDRQLRPFDVTDTPLIDSFLAVPREFFIPDSQADLAYSDLAIKLSNINGPSRTLLPPLILARMIQSAAPRLGQRALTIGGGGYSAAILSSLVSEVVIVENNQQFAKLTAEGIELLGLKNIHIEHAPLSRGAPSLAPFDIILIEGAIEGGLEDILTQLQPTGRLITIATPETGAGKQLLSFSREARDLTGGITILSVNAPVLEGYEKQQDFIF